MSLTIVAASAAFDGSLAKTPGAVHCHRAICHRVLTLAETGAAVGRIDAVLASYYGAPGNDRYNPSSETSSGEIFDPEADDNVASPVLPDGTVILLWNPATRRAAIARVNNAGPYMGARRLDVSRKLAEVLGFEDDGIATLSQVVLSAPSEDEAEYERGRRYPRVAGGIGVFDSIEHAALAGAAGEAVLALRPGLAEPAARPGRRETGVRRQPARPGPTIRSADAEAGRPCQVNQWPGCAFAAD